MNRTVLIAASALAFAACADSPTGTAPEFPGPRFKAEVLTILKGRFPLEPNPNPFFFPCTGEFVFVEGDFNLVVRQVTSDSGHVNFMIHSVGARIRGIGQTTGNEYVGSEHFNFVQHSGGEAENLIIEFTGVFISKGSAPNRKVGKLQIFVVINANGEMTVDRFVVRGFEECQG